LWGFPQCTLDGAERNHNIYSGYSNEQLKWTQDKPRDEELEGQFCQYAERDDSELRERTKAAWGNIKKKNKKELGESHMITTQRYKDWRASRMLPQATPKELLQEEESNLSKESPFPSWPC
jgi:hypothetical protein